MSAATAFLAGATLAFTPIEVDGLFIDGFAGGGGASTGIEQAIGRPVDIAINHSSTAIAIHKANHPSAEHHCTDIRMPFLPRQTTRGRYVAGAWFSPDCKEFSKAKGGPVKDRSIRALCWEVVAWLKDTRPTCGYLENVEEFQFAAPLDEEGRPIKGQEGRMFQRFVRAIRALGYRVQWRVLKACDYGAPTSRKRLYMVMRCDGLPIVWPKPTHGAPGSAEVTSGKLAPYRTAAECIDWSLPCPSIFERARELADATKRRIAHGVMRYVVNTADPFMVPGDLAPFITYGQQGGLNRPADKPLHTATASRKDTNGLAAVTLVQTGYGERPGQAPRVPHIDKPLGTTVAGGVKHAAVTAFLAKFAKGNLPTGPDEPVTTIEARAKQAIVTAHIEQANGGPRNTRSAGRSATRPLSTVTTTGAQQRLVQTTLVEEGALPPATMERAVKVAAFLIKYYGNEDSGHGLDSPIGTVTTKDRFAVVTVTIDAKTYVIVDIGLRMLTPRELANAQGFPPDYVLNPVVRKFLRGKWVERPLTVAEQISAIGNSVCPPVARALVAANQPSRQMERVAA